MVQSRSDRACAAMRNLFEKNHHGASCLRADDFLDARRVLRHRNAVGRRHPPDQPGRDPDAVVGEDRVRRHLLAQSDLDRSERNGQIGRDIARDAETVRGADDLVNADPLGQLEGGDISRVGEGLQQRDASEVIPFVVMGRIGAEGRAGRRRCSLPA